MFAVRPEAAAGLVVRCGDRGRTTKMLRVIGIWGALLSSMGVAVGATGCFTGDEREKDPPPGYPGGLCLAPDGWCEEGVCNRDENYCFDQQDPCRGVFCGGSDRGECMVGTEGMPQCTCFEGFEGETYALYCCPTDGSDPACGSGSDAPSSEDSGGSSGG